jgi:hypothetical protein
MTRLGVMFYGRLGRALAYPLSMTARTATVRLYVALASLVTAVLALAGALVRLAAAVVTRATVLVQGRPEAAQGLAPTPAVPAAGARLTLVPRPTGAPGPSAARARLEGALAGLGFKVGDVRRVVAGLGARVEHEPIEAMIKTALAELSRAA